MAVKITRRIVPALKVEVASFVDQYGSEHIVQQPIQPLADADPEKKVKLSDAPDAEEVSELDLARDQHEAVFEMEADFHQRREQSVAKACDILQRPHIAAKQKDPLADYQGCCGN